MGALAELIKLGIKTAAKQADKAVPKAVSKVDDISVFPKPQRMFPEDARPAGGEYLNPATQDILTGKNFSKGNISITPEGKPSFKVSSSEKEIVGSPDIKGATQIKTNLFKKKAGWKWDKAPKGYEDAPTLVSVENKGKHYYTLDAQFPEGVNLSRYAKSKTEPRLRPTIKGFVELGKPIGKISVRGKEHPVYDKIINREEGGQVLPVIKREAGGGADYEGAAEAYAAMAEENTPTSGHMDDTDAGLYSDAYGQPGKYVSPEDANKDLTGTDTRYNPLQSPAMKAMTSNPYYFNPEAPKNKEEADKQAKDVQLFENFKNYGILDPLAHMTSAERKNEAILEMLEKKKELEEEYGLTIMPDGEIVKMAADEVSPMFKGGQVLEGLDGEYMRKRNSKEKLEGMIGIQPRQYGGGLDDAYMNRRRSSAFAAPDATSAFASPMSMGGLPTVYRQDPGQVGDGMDDDYTEDELSNIGDSGISFEDVSFEDPYDTYDTDPDAGAGSGFGVGAPGISRTDPNQTFENVLDNIPSELGPQYYERQLNKEGLPSWTYPYYNALKDRGMTNDEATAALAAAMATPGGLSGMQSAYEGNYSYGGPLGTMQDLLERGMQSRLNVDDLIEDDKDIKAYNKDDDEEFLSEGELSVSGLKGIYDTIGNLLSVKGDVTPTTMALIDAKAEEQGLKFTPASNIMGNVMNVLLPSVAKGLSNLTGAGRTIGTVTDPKTGQSFNVSDTGKFSLNVDSPVNVDYGNEATPVRKRKPVQKAAASTTEEKPKEGIAGYYERLNKLRPAQSRSESNKYIERLLTDLYPTNTPRLG